LLIVYHVSGKSSKASVPGVWWGPGFVIKITVKAERKAMITYT